MKENRVGIWSKIKVLSYLLGGLLRPNQLKGDLTVFYRAAKLRASQLRSECLVDIFPGIETCQIKLQYQPLLGGGNIADVATISQLAKFLERRCMFEIGTFRGDTTYHLALNTAKEAHVYTLDLPASELAMAKLEITDAPLINKTESGERFHNTPISGKITQLFGDSASFDYSSYEGRIDLVFIDGGHSYEYAMADSVQARRLLSPNGIILWHDYPTWPGVWYCLENLSRQWPGSFVHIKGTALVLWRQ